MPDFRPEGNLTHKENLRTNAYLGFERLCAEGRFDFSLHKKDEYLSRIEYELSVIDNMGFNAYFLIVADFVNYAKSKGIPVGPGRGSGAGSLVAFCVGITDVDPIAFDLLFERFLNPERVSMPDFDIDFCYNRREEVIDYVKEKYGEDKVAQIVTFGTLAARAAVRDVGRALGMPYSRVDAVAKLIPREMNITIDASLKTKELRELYESDEEVRKLLDISKSLEGMPRHASTHAAGVVITEKPTYEYVPLSYSGTGVVTQFDMNTDALLGLVKFDFLGLRYITVISDAEKLVRRKNPDFDISAVPFDDKETFKLLSEARTEGVFQLESGGMKQVLSKLIPSTLEDVIACIALYRPGPMDSIDKFIQRKHGLLKTEYKIPELSEILDVTYGCIVYQEQVMQICRRLAGYSYARADLVRRAMSKKKAEAMNKERDGFIEGAVQNGISRDAAEDIFLEMAGFAKYAFNKSHATAYGIISYRTAYLKAHYPAEYFAALLSSVLSNAQKLRNYIDDAEKHGVRVYPPDINKSEVDFSVSEGNIRYGLLAIRNVGVQFAEAVVKERKIRPFSTFDDFVSRLSAYDINKRTMESLIKCGVFDSLGVTRSSLMACYTDIIDTEHEKSRNNLPGQMDLFSLDLGFASPEGYSYPTLPEYQLKELLQYEKENSGIYFSGHLIDNYSKHLSTLKYDRISDILGDGIVDGVDSVGKYKDRQTVSLVGIISAKKTKSIKNGDTMAFITLDDRFGEIEVIVFARQYAKYSLDLTVDSAVHITGTLSLEDGEDSKILLSTLTPLLSNDEYETQKKTLPEKEERLYIKVSSMSDTRISSLLRMAMLNPGKTKIAVFDESTKKYSVLKDASILASQKVLSRLFELFGKENVVLK